MKYQGLLLGMMLLGTSFSANAQDQIHLNQIGFYPNAPKEAVVVEAEAGPFYVLRVTSGDTVYTGTLGEAQTWQDAGERVRVASFTAVDTQGRFVLDVPGVGQSYPFTVNPAVHRAVAAAALKGYYFQRMSASLNPRQAGAWARSLGHPDDAVLVHASAASAERPEGTLISAPRGWYDAGDFNKYIVNSGITTYTLLALYEHYPTFMQALNTGILESRDDVPDLLNETFWNLSWMLAMQDPNDGGVYHKLTHANFQGVIMPHQATAPRYVVQKSTAAALNFAAVMAQAARIYADFPTAFPGLADSMRTAALDAWGWARQNRNVTYNQNALNQQYDPDINTGGYDVPGYADEFAWAAAELFLTTRADSFLTIASPLNTSPDVPSWGGVRTLGWYSLLHHRKQAAAVADTASMKRRFLAFADQLAASRTQAPYRIVMGRRTNDFVWGSNAVAANQAMALMQAYRISADTTYLWAALSNLDYILGRNATGFSFVTGYGAHTPMHPHHRQSEADAVDAPVPGLLAGGPNPNQQDRCTYPSDLPARSYVDDWCSYASNEIAINWNAPLVYLAAAIEAEMEARANTTDVESDMGTVLPTRFLPPYPNPSADRVTLAFELAAPAEIRLDAVDVMGRRVASWMPRPYGAGTHRLAWAMHSLADGLYVVRLTSGAQVQSYSVLKVQDGIN